MPAQIQKNLNGLQFYKCRYHFSNSDGFQLALLVKNGQRVNVYKGEEKNGKITYPNLNLKKPDDTFRISGNGSNEISGKIDVNEDGVGDKAWFENYKEVEWPERHSFSKEVIFPALAFSVSSEQASALRKKFGNGYVDVNYDNLKDRIIQTISENNSYGTVLLLAADRNPD